MIAYLRGQILSLSPERLLLDVNGVGYEVFISLATYSELDRAGAEAGVGLFVHTHVWPDGLVLYGFWTEREKALFEKLISVSGIGPRLARGVLSGIPPADLAVAIAAGDVKRLTAIPGVGKKTAERMVVELRDKVGELPGVSADLAATLPPVPPGDAALVSALVNLGYKEVLADKAVREARRDLPDGAFGDLLRASLARLSRGV